MPDLHPNSTLPEGTTSKPHYLCRQLRDSEPFLAALELGGSGWLAVHVSRCRAGSRPVTVFVKCQQSDLLCYLITSLHTLTPPSSSDLFPSPLPTQRRGHTCPSTPTAVSLNQLSESCFGLQLAGRVKGREAQPYLQPGTELRGWDLSFSAS